MKLPNITVKSPLFIYSLIVFVIIISSVFFVPKSVWKNIFNIKGVATSFYASPTSYNGTTTGYWNVAKTWGLANHLAQISGPDGLFISSSPYIYVINVNSNKVSVLNPDGTASTSYSVGLNDPHGMTVSDSGYIYLVDRGNNRIIVLNPDGTASTTFGSNPTFQDPQDIVISSLTGYIYVNDILTGVQVFNPDGTASTTYNGDSLAPIQGRGITMDQVTGELYLSDTNNNRIVVLNPDGTASTSYSNVDFDYPIRITRSITSGDIYVTNTNNHLIVVLNPDGTASTTYDIGISGVGIALDNQGYIYVSDKSNNQIIVLNPDGTASTTRKGTDYSPSVVMVEGTDYPGPNDNANISSGNIILSADQSTHDLSLSTGGTLDLNGHVLRVGGNWTNTGGTFLANNGSVNFAATDSQSINGDNTFYNFSKTSTNTESFLFDINATTTVTNNISINGADNNILTVGLSSSPQSHIFATSVAPVGLTNIKGIAADSHGNIFITESGSSTVQKYDSDGVYLSSFGSYGTSSGQFNSPVAIAIDSADNIYVADYNNYRIEKFDSSGNFQFEFGSNGSSDGEFLSLSGVAVDSDGNIYASDINNHRVQKFDSTGHFILKFGTVGSGDTQMVAPFGLAVDSQGNIYVAEIGNYRIHKFDSDGNYVAKVGASGSQDGQFSSINGVAVDKYDNIYALDQGNHRIQKFNSSLVFQSKFGISGYGNGEFNSPYNLVLDSSDNLYVTDSNYDGSSHSRYQKFVPNSNSAFKILKTGSGTASFSYLYVSNSNNVSDEPFYCLTGCVDGGNNTNWIFPALHTTTGVGIVDLGSVSSSTAENITLPGTSTMETASSTESASSSTEVVASSTPQAEILPPGFCFTKNLYPYISDPDVKNLQIFLNDKGFSNVPSGTENNYYGPETTNAVILFQENYYSEILGPLGLKNGTGNFGNETRKKVNDFLGCETIPEIKPKASSTTPEVTLPTPPAQENVIPEVKLPTSNQPNNNVPQTNTNQEPQQNLNVVAPTSVLGMTDMLQQLSKNFLSYTKDLIGNLGSLFNNASFLDIIKKIFEQIGQFINSPMGSIVTKSISTIGIISFILQPMLSVTFSDLWLIISRYLGLLLGSLGIKRKSRPWGTVYDSVTKRPLDPVYVSLINTETNKEVASAITDIDGRYGFLVMPGKYRIEVKKTNYVSPSVKMKGRVFDEVYNDIYFGEEILVTEEGQVITKNIPMDSLSFDWNEFAKTRMNVNTFLKAQDITWARISKFIFVIGAIVSFIAVVFAPAPYNFIVGAFYIAAYILNYVVIKSNKSGALVDKNTNVPLSFALVKIFREGEDSPLVKKITDKFGEYYVLIPNGRYYIKIDKKNDDETYSEIFKTSPLDIKNGIVNFNFRI